MWIQKWLIGLSLVTLNTAYADDLAQLIDTKTVIYNATITYTIQKNDGTVEERSSALFKRMKSNEDCQTLENATAYKDFQLVTIVEVPKEDEAAFSQWIEGVKLINAKVVKRETQFCFAAPIVESL